MLEQFEELREKIRANVNEGYYAETIKSCLFYLVSIQDLNKTDLTSDKLFIYHDLSKAYNNLNKIEIAIKYELKALNCADNIYKEIVCYWQLSECYKNENNYKKALDLLTKCSEGYKEIGEDKQRVCVIWEKAKILKNVRAMERLIHIYEVNEIESSFNDFHGLDNMLRDMYTDLFNLYIVDNKAKAFELLYSIKDKNLKKELYKRMIA